MRQYILKRILLAGPSIIILTIIVFSLMRIVPGDVVMAMIGEQGNILSKESLEAIRHDLGLDRPYLLQYGSWLWGIMRGDLGDSLWTKQPVIKQLAETLPVTIELGLIAIVVALVIGIPVGVLSAIRQDTGTDYVGRLVAIMGISVPDFWIGTIVILVLSVGFNYLPSLQYIPPWKGPWENFQQFIFPGLILGTRLSAITMRMTRSTMLEVVRQDYIRTAYAKGLRGRTVIARHALKNAVIPVITIIGSQIAGIFGGAVIIETLFSLEGIGQLTFFSINQRDYPQIQGNILFLGVVLILMNLLVDLAYAWLDPRIRYK